MNIWLYAATALLVATLPCVYVAMRSPAPTERLVAFEAVGTITALALVLLAQGFGRPLFFDVALILALFSFGGGLVYAHLLERWV